MIIYRFGSLGDTIVALPALKLAARAFPAERRIMLTNLRVSTKAVPIPDILENMDLIDEYIQYPTNLRNPLALLKLRRRIRNLHQDVLVYLMPSRGRLKALRDLLFFRACGIKTIIGISLTAAGQTRRPVGNGRYEYEGARLLRSIGGLGQQDIHAPEAFDLKLTKAERANATALLEPCGAMPVLAVSIGTKTDVGDWGQDNWRRLIVRLAADLPGWGLVLLGVQAEMARSAALAMFWDGPALNLCGQINVRGAAAILERAKIFLGHDSGPMHLAAAVGTPCVAIFSARNEPGIWFPPGNTHKILYHEIACSGCLREVCEDRKKACIMAITVTDVRAAVLELANANFPAPARANQT
jgi:ADP-heptose:LPS heptosyltransferase